MKDIADREFLLSEAGGLYHTPAEFATGHLEPLVQQGCALPGENAFDGSELAVASARAPPLQPEAECLGKASIKLLPFIANASIMPTSRPFCIEPEAQPAWAR
jgi:hypothetical protein